MKRHKHILTFLFLLLLLAKPSEALLLYDSGTPIRKTETYFHPAVKFNLDQAYTITGIEGYYRSFNNFLTGEKEVKFTPAIFEGTGEFPNPDKLVIKFDLWKAVTTENELWSGPRDLNLQLSAGDYWLDFQPGIIFQVLQGAAPNDVFKDGALVLNSQFQSKDDIRPGVRIYAEPLQNSNTIPEPTTLALLSCGIISLGFKRKFK